MREITNARDGRTVSSRPSDASSAGRPSDVSNAGRPSDASNAGRPSDAAGAVDLSAAAEAEVRFGRIAVSEKQAPNLFVNLVYELCASIWAEVQRDTVAGP